MNMRNFLRFQNPGSMGVAFMLALVVSCNVYASNILQVGPARTYKTLPAAVAAAANGDTIEIDAGLYQGAAACATINQNGITIKGVGGRPKLDSYGVDVGGKGILLQYGSDLTVDNIEFANAVCASGNGAGIRAQGTNLTVRNCYFHECQDGILNAGGVVLIEHCEFFDNGYGDVGYDHNVYIAATCTSLTFQYNYSHGCYVGHDLKTRALVNYILYNRLTDENGRASYNIDVPQGGTAYIIGNLIQKGPNAQNEHLVTYAEESTANPDQHLYLVNNTLVNDLGWGTFVRNLSGTPAQLTNNIFFGAGTTLLEGTATQTTNLVTSDPSIFVDRAGYNYNLSANSAAIDAGSPLGLSFASYALTPTLEYVQPLSSTARPVSGALDIGAYEFVPSAISGTVSGSAPGATLTMSGTAAGTTSSGNNGAYIFEGLSNGSYTLVPSQSGYTFTPPSALVTISGASVTQNFAASGYSVTFAAGANGGIDLPGIQSTGIGNGITVNATANPGSHFVNWTDDSSPSNVVGASTALTVSSAQAGRTITANFSANGQYAVTFAAGSNGGVSLSGVQTASTGNTISVTATANPSFQFLNWTDNSVPAHVVSTNATLIADGTLEGKTITANFGLIEVGFAVTFAPGPHGTVQGITPQIVGSNGDCMPVTATPDVGYHFVSWTGTNNFVTTAANPLDPSLITGDTVNKTVTANFAPDVYNLTGTVSGAPNAPLVLITLTLPNLSTQTTHPASNGSYSFSGLLAGSYTVTPTLTGYTFTPLSASPTIVLSDVSVANFAAKANQTISFGVLPNKTYGNAAFTLNATATSGLPVSFSVVSGPASLLGNSLTITGAGPVSIKASQAGGAMYAAAPDVTQSFNVAAAALTVTATSASKNAGDANPVLAFTYSGLVNSDASATFSGSLATTATATSPAGAYPISQGTLAATGNYTIGTFVAANLTVNAVVNTPPVISSVIATPSSVLTGESVAFLVGVSDADGDQLTYLWDFGDGTTSTLAAPTHAFATGGSKTVSVTVSDSSNFQASGTVAVQVAAPLPINISKLSGAVHFSQANKDGANIAGTLTGVPAGFSPAGQTLTLNLSGASVDFTLSATGKATAAHGSIALTLPKVKALKSKKGASTSTVQGSVPFKASIKGGTYAAAWGLTAATLASSVPFQLTITLSGTVYSSGIVHVTYKPAKGSGSFKK